MAVLLYKKGENRQISDHFNSSEFECHCGMCKTLLVDTEMVERLEKLRELLGTPITITSGYRCHDYQVQLRIRGYETAVGTSEHELGRASDITNGVALGMELCDLAKQAGFKAIGVGKHWVHLDLRNDKERVWYYLNS